MSQKSYRQKLFEKVTRIDIEAKLSCANFRKIFLGK
jgi:hypothetical protein